VWKSKVISQIVQHFFQWIKIRSPFLTSGSHKKKIDPAVAFFENASFLKMAGQQFFGCPSKRPVLFGLSQTINR
jgi:hypothetical protein